MMKEVIDKNKLHDINQSALDQASSAPQLMSRNYCVCVCVRLCVRVRVYVCACVYVQVWSL